MAKVVGVQQLQNKVKLTIERSLSSRTILEAVGKFSRDRIYAITKLGFSMSGNSKKKLAPLADWYKGYRKRYQEKTQTGASFSPNKSNLTLSGQMLDALTYKIDQARKTVQVFVQDSGRKPNPYPLRGRKNDSRSNAQVAKEVAQKGRPFIGLDQDAVKRIKNDIVSELRRALRREGLRK